MAALEKVKSWKELGAWLDVPRFRRDTIAEKQTMLNEWLENHPAPSWKILAWALYRRGKAMEHNVLKQLYEKHITGMYYTVGMCAV